MQVQKPVTTFEITNLPKGTEPRQLVDILDEGGFTDQFDMLLLGRENEDGHTTIINFRWAQVCIVIAWDLEGSTLSLTPGGLRCLAVSNRWLQC